MNPWGPFAAALGWNYIRHRRRKPTICSTTRRIVPKPLAGLLLFVGFVALAAHVLDGYTVDIDLTDRTPQRG